ncbi:DUF1707 SHOCT-like domain-containing protein, partial [Nocardiopsis potens]|uniref:DUF1707 SHOCT-like domain-containing protein n=1 Tax=Nocardiopsis potens TaxID=1246458 RepID=UPI00036BA118
MPVPDDALRASDRERDAALDRLRTAYQEGMLTGSEHERRAGEALAARTRGDLAPLLADLPDRAPAARRAPVSPLHAWALFSAIAFVLWVAPATALGLGGPSVLAWLACCLLLGAPAAAVAV